MKIILRVKFRAFGIDFHKHEQTWELPIPPGGMSARTLYDRKGVFLRVEPL